MKDNMLQICTRNNTDEWNKRKSKPASFFIIHTTSRCCSPLMSMASRLTIEHASAGKVTSNCTFNIKTTKNQLLHEANKSNHITDLFGLTYFSLSTSI